MEAGVGLFWRDSGGKEYELTEPLSRDTVEVSETFKVAKTDDAKQLVFGWANVAVDKDGSTVVDSQDDLIDTADLEDAAYMFTLNFREGDEMHTEDVKMHLVESMVFTPEKMEKLGLAPDALPTGWWTGFHVPDKDVYEKVRSGDYAMFSIGGVGVREKVA